MSTRNTPRMSGAGENWVRSLLAVVVIVFTNWQMFTAYVDRFLEQKATEQQKELITYIDGRLLVLQDSLEAHADSNATATNARLTRIEKRIPKRF